MTRIQHRDISEDEHNQISKDICYYGYSRIENFLFKEEVSTLKSKILQEKEKLKNGPPLKGIPARDEKDQIVYNLQNKDKAFIDLISLGPIVRILKEKLNDEYYTHLSQEYPNYNLTYFNARSSGYKLDLHIDSGVPYCGKKVINMQIAVILDDQTIENGCTVLVPGSHQSGAYTDRSFENVIPINSRKGDMVVWDSRIWHGTTENTANLDRWAIIASFARWWVKPSMDIPRGLPQNIYDSLARLLPFNRSISEHPVWYS